MRNQAIAEPSQRVALTHRILRNTMIITIGEGIIKLLSLAFNIMTVRLLGEIGLGEYATVIAFAGLFGIFLDLGISQYVTRSIAQDRTKTAELFWNLLILRVFLALCGLLLIPFFAQLSSYSPDMVLGTLLYSITFVFASILSPLTSVLEANERFDVSSVVAVIGQVISILLGMLLLWLGYGFLGLLCVGFVAMFVQIVVTLRAMRIYKLSQLPFRFAPETWLTLIRASLPFGLTTLALTLNFNADSIILSWYHPVQEVGWYNAAYRLIFSIVGLGSGFLTAMTPSIASEYMHDPLGVHTWTRNSISWLSLFALPSMVGVALLAPRIIDLLYGSAFAPSQLSLIILSFDIPLLLLTAFCGNITAAVGLERPAARIYVSSVLLNVVLNLIVIPKFGMLGASVVTIITDLLSTSAFFLLLHRHMHIMEILPRLLSILLAAGLMGLGIWLAHPLPLILLIVLAGLAYIALVWRLGVIDQQALIKLRGLIPLARKGKV